MNTLYTMKHKQQVEKSTHKSLVRTFVTHNRKSLLYLAIVIYEAEDVSNGSDVDLRIYADSLKISMLNNAKNINAKCWLK